MDASKRPLCAGFEAASQLQHRRSQHLNLLRDGWTRCDISRGGTTIEGLADDVQLQAENASITETFAALSARFNLTYNIVPNGGRVATGLYSGWLREVLARILAGNDYVLGVLDDRVRIVVVNAWSAD